MAALYLRPIKTVNGMEFALTMSVKERKPTANINTAPKNGAKIIHLMINVGTQMIN
jgi:hypothetical protein